MSTDANIKLLLVEDEPNFGSVLTQFLNLHHFDVHWAKDGAQAWSYIHSQQPIDACILDVMMPEMDGFEVGKALRKVRPSVPFIYLTARSMREDMIAGFQIGADDYITKPFDSEILVYKLKALLQRNQQENRDSGPIAFGATTLNPELRTITHGNREIRLSPKECALLQMLANNSNRVVSREEIVVRIWGTDSYFTRRSMDVYVTKLRKHLEMDSSLQLLSIHAGGYMLKIDAP